MKVLTLHQPWATLVAIGAKKIETRSWATKYRGPLAIHASKSFPGVLKTLCMQEPFFDALVVGFCMPNHIVPSKMVVCLPLGSILCVCDLVDCAEMGVIGDYTPEPERSFGHYAPGRFAWHLANVRPLQEPIPAKGLQRLWTPGPELLAEIMSKVA